MPKQKNSVPDAKKEQLWNAENIALLGTMRDEELAAKLGIKGASVWHARTKRGIEPFGKHPESQSIPPAPQKIGKSIVWSADALDVLGKISDSRLALAWKLTMATIRTKRRELGINPKQSRATFEWTAEAENLVGTIKDRALARKLGTTNSIIRNKRLEMGLPAYKNAFPVESIEKLGTVSDSTISAEVGMGVSTIASIRRKLKISPRRKETVWSDQFLAMLGKMPDLALARKMGCSNYVVRLKRIKLGIEIFQLNKSFNKSFPTFSALEKCPQNEFFSVLASAYHAHAGDRLTYPNLSKMCLWSVSRLQKWFTPGTAQEPLQLPVRHHIYLSVKDAITYF